MSDCENCRFSKKKKDGLLTFFVCRKSGDVNLKTHSCDEWMTRKRKYLNGTIRKKIWLKFQKKCVTCGCETKLFGNSVSPFSLTPCAIDHIIPFSKGGLCEESNFQLLCLTCNSQKGNK